MSFFAEIQ